MMKISMRQAAMVSALSMALCSTVAVSAPALDQSGTINLSGYIYSATCELDINSQGPNMATVLMGRHSAAAFTQAGTEVGGSGNNGKIDIKLYNCPDSGELQLTLTGAVSANDPKILKLTGEAQPETAKNVGVHIYRKDALNAPLVLDGSQVYRRAISGEGEEWVEEYVAKYVSTADVVTAGEANATVDYKITYQ